MFQIQRNDRGQSEYSTEELEVVSTFLWGQACCRDHDECISLSRFVKFTLSHCCLLPDFFLHFYGFFFKLPLSTVFHPFILCMPSMSCFCLNHWEYAPLVLPCAALIITCNFEPDLYDQNNERNFRIQMLFLCVWRSSVWVVGFLWCVDLYTNLPFYPSFMCQFVYTSECVCRNWKDW